MKSHFRRALVVRLILVWKLTFQEFFLSRTWKLTFRGHLPRKPLDHLVLCLRSPQELQWGWNPGWSVIERIVIQRIIIVIVIERIVKRRCMFEQRFWYNLQVIACQISSLFLFSFISLIPFMRFKIEEKQCLEYDWHHSYPAVRSWLSEDIDRLLWPLFRLAALWPYTGVFFGGEFAFVRILLVQTNYLTIAKWCQALHRWTVAVLLVTQLNGREKLS